jgi:REP element-mobilizing transposase RayT
MARPLRIEYPGAFYHVINRGLERREIFRTNKDYEYFLDLLDNLHEKYGLWVHSYCLMPNHYHLFIETPNGGLSKAMRQLDGNFTQKFNKRVNRVGPLMQGRYKATLIDQDSYSLQLSKYIHLNPVKAKIADKPENYKWSSYSAFIGKVKPPAFLKTDWLLSQFSKSKTKARKAFKVFTNQKDEGDSWSPEQEAYKGIILGSSDFVEQIQKEFLQGKTNKEIPKLKAVQKTLAADEIENRVDTLKLSDKLKFKLKVYALKKYSPLTLKQIGDRTGGLHYSAISQIFIRLNSKSKEDNEIKKLLAKIDVMCNLSKIQT